jgi:hypothetical protein
MRSAPLEPATCYDHMHCLKKSGFLSSVTSRTVFHQSAIHRLARQADGKHPPDCYYTRPQAERPNSAAPAAASAALTTCAQHMTGLGKTLLAQAL